MFLCYYLIQPNKPQLCFLFLFCSYFAPAAIYFSQLLHSCYRLTSREVIPPLLYLVLPCVRIATGKTKHFPILSLQHTKKAIIIKGEYVQTSNTELHLKTQDTTSFVNTDITYQNKDITSKILAEGMKEKSLAVYGIHVPKIIDVLPTNLPAIEANELRMDNLFLLEDGSYALLDYESKYSEADKITYINYVARTLKRLLSMGIKDPRIRMIVIYTSNVKKANSFLNAGCMQFTIEPGFLAHIKTEQLLKKLQAKVRKRELLNDTDLMQLIVLPLTVGNKKKQKQLLQQAIELAKNIIDEHQQVFALSGIVTFSDKIIEPEFADTIRRWIQMTKVGRLFELEKEEAVKNAKASTALNLASMGMTIENIARAVDENIEIVTKWLQASAAK